MLGLGLGSLAGGALSKNPKRPALVLFGIAELGIGAFGFLSLAMFRNIGALTLSLPPAGTATVTFLLVLFPTLLMGATLPLLVAHTTRLSGNVGRSVGTLYFINTLGSALAAGLAVVLFLRVLGQSGSVMLAAFINVIAGIAVLVIHRRIRIRS